MSVVLAIDPGPVQSAWLVMGHKAPRAFGLWDNGRLVDELASAAFSRDIETLVVEKIASYGMAVGAEVFETVWWSGRFHEAALFGASIGECARLERLRVKLALCHDSRAKDANIRQALIDRFGGAAAIGKKATPGPLYGIAGDVWSALAVAVVWQDGAR